MKNKSGYDVRSIRDLKDMVEQSSTLFGAKNAFLLKNKDGSFRGITYSAFKEDIDAFGTALLNLGLKDKYIAVIGENRYEWAVTYLSTVNGTGIIVPMDKELHLSEIENLLARSNASAVVFSGKQAEDVKKIAASLPSLQYFIHMDLTENEGNFLSFSSLVNEGKKHISSGDRSFIDAKIDPDHMNILLFTSGTTDLAKGVMLSHRNICYNITAVLSTVHVTSEDSCLSILPMHHTYECTLGFLAIIYAGGTISFNEGLKYISKNLKEYKPTLLFTVPLLLENVHKKIWEQAAKGKATLRKLKFALTTSNVLLKAFKIDVRRELFKQIQENMGGRMRLIFTGAAGIDPQVSRHFREFGIKVLQGYGLTECAPLVIGNRDYSYKDGSIGLPLPGMEVRIDNPGPDGVGELVVKGPNVMLGYFKNEEATAACLHDGWLHTGDLGYVDKDGFYFITGRSKNVIVTKNGKNIFPEEVESYINKSPYVLESMVWGKYDEVSGETFVNAQIVPNFEAIKEKLKVPHVSVDDIRNLLNEAVKIANKSMPLYKRIQDFTVRETEFVKTTTKKIKRYIENKK